MFINQSVIHVNEISSFKLFLADQFIGLRSMREFFTDSYYFKWLALSKLPRLKTRQLRKQKILSHQNKFLFSISCEEHPLLNLFSYGMNKNKLQFKYLVKIVKSYGLQQYHANYTLIPSKENESFLETSSSRKCFRYFFDGQTVFALIFLDSPRWVKGLQNPSRKTFFKPSY